MPGRTTLTHAFAAVVLIGHLAFPQPGRGEEDAKTTKFARIKVGDKTTFAIVEGDRVRELKGKPTRHPPSAK